MISDRLDRLVDEMVERGVQFDDAIHEFEKRFIARVLGCCDGSLIKTADTLGIHRNTLTRKMDTYKIKKRDLTACPTRLAHPACPPAEPARLALPC